MSRQIVILNSELDPGTGQIRGTIAYWLTTPTNLLPYAANPALKSVVPDATTAELTALQNGAVREVVVQGEIPTTATTAQIEQSLLASFAQAQQTLNAQEPPKRFTTGAYDPATGWANMPV